MSTITWTLPRVEALNRPTLAWKSPSFGVAAATMAKLATVWPATQLTLETSGITSLLAGKARRLPPEVPPVTVRLQAIALASGGTSLATPPAK